MLDLKKFSTHFFLKSELYILMGRYPSRKIRTRSLKTATHSGSGIESQFPDPVSSYFSTLPDSRSDVRIRLSCPGAVLDNGSGNRSRTAGYGSYPVVSVTVPDEGSVSRSRTTVYGSYPMIRDATIPTLPIPIPSHIACIGIG